MEEKEKANCAMVTRGSEKTSRKETGGRVRENGGNTSSAVGDGGGRRQASGASCLGPGERGRKESVSREAVRASVGPSWEQTANIPFP